MFASSKGTLPRSSTICAQERPSSAKPADGPRLEGAGYAYRVPKDWGPSDQEIPGFDPDTFALDLDDNDGFTDNVNVLLAPGGAMSAEQAEVGAKDELTSAGATGVAVRDRVDVGGREAAHVSAGMSLNDNDYQVEQFYAATDDETSSSRSPSAGASATARGRRSPTPCWPAGPGPTEARPTSA